MKMCTCVSVVVFSGVGFCSLAFFLIYLKTEVLNYNIYRAAVLEIVPNRNASLPIKELLIRNLEIYVSAVKIAFVHDVDIIVFPEDGLYGLINERNNATYSVMENIPNPKEFNYIPCLQPDKFKNSPILQVFSCLALYGGMYIVANMIDFKPCNDSYSPPDICTNTDCPHDGFYLFNTNVVFNKKGTLITRYHKKHLIYEDYLNPSNCYDDGYFETEFGKFLTTISVDLLYNESTLAIEKLAPDTIVYSTYWQKHTPFHILSSSFQQSYAFTRNINLLSASMYDIVTGELRSVIYSGTNGPLIKSIGPYEYNTLLISNVPKNPIDYHKPFSLRRKKFLINNNSYYEMDFKETVKFESDCDSKLREKINKKYEGSFCLPVNSTYWNSVKLRNLEDSLEVCMNGLCCSLMYKAKEMKDDYFFLVSSYDATSFDSLTSKYESCILTSCLTKDGKSCTHLTLKSHTIFYEIKVKGDFKSNNVFPVATDSRTKSTKSIEWEFDGNSSISYKNLRHKSILTFGLFGRQHK